MSELGEGPEMTIGPDRVERLETELFQLEAQCAAMRAEVERDLELCDHYCPDEECTACASRRQALASDAGKALLERLEKAERELKTRYAETTPDEIQALRNAGPDVMLAEILRYRNMLGRAMHNTEQAFAECAEIAEGLREVGDGSLDTGRLHRNGVLKQVAEAIRAKAGET